MATADPDLRRASTEVRDTLERALAGQDVTVDEATRLLGCDGDDREVLMHVADALRAAQAGDEVTWVANRNINFTNICAKRCHFCAFSRTSKSDEGYFLTVAEVVDRAVEAAELGATEVCLQAGLVSSVRGRGYLELTAAVRAALPDIHIHAFSPEEVAWGAGLARATYREYLTDLRDAGLDTLPGTSAEILDDEVRERLAPGRITSGQWVELVSTAHELGIRTSSTMMYGHLETPRHRAAHMVLLRSLQRDTGGFTEFVPLSFVAEDAPLFTRTLDPSARSGPAKHDVMNTFAVARIVLGRDIPNLQVSWVKDGFETAADLLRCGANDLGGTLINESISTSAGASWGQLATPSRLRAVAAAAGRPAVQRTTVYGRVAHSGAEVLDSIEDADARFGSYATLVASDSHRYDPRRHLMGRAPRSTHAPDQ